jgi:hypothetical protein
MEAILHKSRVFLRFSVISFIWRLVKKSRGQPLALQVRKPVILANCLLVNVSSIALTYTANAFQRSFKDVFGKRSIDLLTDEEISIPERDSQKLHSSSPRKHVSNSD